MVHFHLHFFSLSSSPSFTVGAFIVWRIVALRRRPNHTAKLLQRKEDVEEENLALADYHIEVVETAHACDEFLATRVSKTPKIIGLDCEWRSESDIPVALLQLAFPNKECLLVQLCKMREIPPKLAEILADKRCGHSRATLVTCQNCYATSRSLTTFLSMSLSFLGPQTTS